MLPSNQGHLNQRTSHLSRWIIRAVLLDICVLIVLEVVIRMVAPVYARMWTDRDFTQGVAKAGRGYESGSELLRTPKPNGVRRVAFFGDSVTYGFGLPVDQTVSAQTERVLNEQQEAGRWECVNMAGQGTSPIISLLNINRDIDAWQVDLLIYQFNMSDVGEDPTLASEKVFAKLQAAKKSQGPLSWRKLYQKSALYNYVVRETDTINYLIGGRKIDLKHWRDSAYWKELAARFDSPEVRAGWNRQFEALAQIHSLCKQRGIAFMVIMLPYQYDMADGLPDNFWGLDRTQFEVNPYDRFEEIAKQFDLNHKQYLEALRSVRQAMLRGDHELYPIYFPHDVGHLTVQGVRILAPVLAQDVRDLLR